MRQAGGRLPQVLVPGAPTPSPQPTVPPRPPPEQVQVEERHHNEHALETLVCDSFSAMVAATIITGDAKGRTALANTFGRLFEGLSDIAKAVLIILVADTMLGWVRGAGGGGPPKGG
jgi:hypothetical protein